MIPAAPPDEAMAAMFSAVSRRKQMLMAADCSSVRGGGSRVLTLPGRRAFPTTVSADWLLREPSGFLGLRTGYDMVEVDIVLGRTPVGVLLFLPRVFENGRRLFADGVLVQAIALQIDGPPGPRVDQCGKVRGGHHIGLSRFAVFASWSTPELGE